MIRLATLHDIPELVPLVSRCMLEELTDPPIPDEDTIEDTLLMLIRQQNGHAMALVSENDGKIDGIICGMKTPDFATREVIVIAILYYVVPEKRKSKLWKELAKSFEEWGRYIAKASQASISCLNPKIGRAYNILGYKQAEICFKKEL